MRAFEVVFFVPNWLAILRRLQDSLFDLLLDYWSKSAAKVGMLCPPVLLDDLYINCGGFPL